MKDDRLKKGVKNISNASPVSRHGHKTIKNITS